MTVRLHALATVLPPTTISQSHAADLFARQPSMSRLGSRLVRSVFAGAQVRTRRTVLRELGDAASGAPRDDATSPDAAAPSLGEGFLDPATGELAEPGTAARNEIFAREASGLFTAAARAALGRAAHLAPQDVTHVVTVSCTGFFAPGPDVRIVKALGLAPDVVRIHLGFMGCNAAFGALRTAAAFCTADPRAVVLVVCAELCTLHLHVRNDPDTIMGNALFGDGAAGVVLSARPGPAGDPLLELVDQETLLAPDGERELAWSIGDRGFEMILGAEVPRLIDAHVDSALRPLLDRAGRGVADIEHWAIHPGGRQILDRVEARLGLTARQMAASRDVLAEVGNISSVTILAVIERLLDQGLSGTLCAIAFGPGLSVESALLHRPEEA
ncbi:type III polyketide synthase [Brachybacterium paraconglomeratum]|uniref:type III polyketide synthase n=1 Tax=Brachybacterium paraconglomeratum TaxID=173362 RepID=UPI002939F0D1|nr:type III polyketide synthase [Brachybacterium paraconglomeratum]